MPPPTLTIDARLLGQSGIGRYLSEVLPRLLPELPGRRVVLGGDAAGALVRRVAAPGVEHHAVEAKMYSVREQLRIPRATPPGTDLFWSPHYNIPLAHRGKLLVTIHDILHQARPEFVGGVHRRLYARAMFGAVTRRAERIICDSRFTADEVMRLLGVEPRRITVIYPGVGEFWFEPVDTSPPHTRPYLLYVGNVKPHKNLGRLVEAFSGVAGEIEQDLVIVGRREGFLTGDREIEERAERLGGRVHFTGEISDLELRRCLAHADALVFPSLYEGFGLPPLEAMAAGCPALVSRAASLPEACGDAALYFDPMDPGEIARAILSITSQPALRDDLRARGREHARGFTWDRCAQQTRGVLEELLA